MSSGLASQRNHLTSTSGGASGMFSSGGALASMRASVKSRNTSSNNTNNGSEPSVSSRGGTSTSSKKEDKPKKLSERGKTKLATQRANERITAELTQLEQAYAENHPDLIDANGEMEMPAIDDLFADGMTGEARLQTYIQAERRQIENEEMVRKLARLQRKHNTMQNALLKGNRVAEGYNREAVDMKIVQRELKKTKEREAKAIITLDTPIPLIRAATTAAAIGQKALLEYLNKEETINEFAATDKRYLFASVDAELDKRITSHLNYRYELISRLAVTLQEFRRGDRELNLRLAQYCYQRLLDACDPAIHPYQSAGLCNSLEQCDIELDRLTGAKILQKANHDFEYTLKDDPNANFDFERKLTKAEKKKEKEKEKEEEKEKERDRNREKNR